MVRPRSAFLALVAALASIEACSLLNPLEGYSGGVLTEAGVEGTDATLPERADAAGGVDSSTSCVGARAPTRGDGSATGGTTTIVSALSSYEFSEADDPSRPFSKGLDLDHTCTCPGPRSCKPANGTTGVCDFANGVDNAAGDYFLSLLSVLGRQATITAKIQNGDYGLVLRVRNYNELPNDDDVELAVFNSFGLDRTPETGSDAGLPANAVPKFDGTDRWTVDSKSLLGGTAYLPNVVDTRAYVRDGVVVAQVSNADSHRSVYGPGGGRYPRGQNREGRQHVHSLGRNGLRSVERARAPDRTRERAEPSRQDLVPLRRRRRVQESARPLLQRPRPRDRRGARRSRSPMRRRKLLHSIHLEPGEPRNRDRQRPLEETLRRQLGRDLPVGSLVGESELQLARAARTAVRTDP